MDGFCSRPYWMKCRLGVIRIEVASGKQELVRRLMPSDSAGVYRLLPIELSPDGKCYAYSYGQTLSDLYVVDGLH